MIGRIENFSRKMEIIMKIMEILKLRERKRFTWDVGFVKVYIDIYIYKELFFERVFDNDIQSKKVKKMLREGYEELEIFLVIEVEF